MQLVLSGNRIIAHGENFLAMGGVVINTETGEKYDNATVAECDGCPSDIDTVGYEYHAGTFVPCAPYGKGDGNGYFMEVCGTCATPRNSGVPIKGGLKLENLHPEVLECVLKHELLWENENPEAEFNAQTVPFSMSGYVGFFVVIEDGQTAFINNQIDCETTFYIYDNLTYKRTVSIEKERAGITFSGGSNTTGGINHNKVIPLRIYGVKL